MKDITQIVRPPGFELRAKQKRPGMYVVVNAYEGHYDFFGEPEREKPTKPLIPSPAQPRR